jgi:hypothetical protein
MKRVVSMKPVVSMKLGGLMKLGGSMKLGVHTAVRPGRPHRPATRLKAVAR